MNFILIHMVPVDGLEPSLPQRNRILNPACLPIPPHWQVLGYLCLNVILPLVKSYGVISTVTLSPGNMRI